MSNSTRGPKILVTAAFALALAACGSVTELGGAHGHASAPVTTATKDGADAHPGVTSTWPASTSGIGTVTTVATDQGADDGEPPATTMPPAADEPAPLPDDPTKTSFRRDVLPIFAAKCHECHHDGSPHTNLTRFPVPGQKDQKAYAAALLVAAAPTSGRMPPAPRDALTPAEFAVLERWQADGLRP